jgi:hypothetical protein
MGRELLTILYLLCRHGCSKEEHQLNNAPGVVPWGVPSDADGWVYAPECDLGLHKRSSGCESGGNDTVGGFSQHVAKLTAPLLSFFL